MNRLCTSVNDMRLNRKRFSISGSLFPLLLLLVLLVAQTSGRPSSVNGTTKNDVSPAAFDETEDGMTDVAVFEAGDDYADVDNVEWHHVKVVDGIMREDHPIIMYKEDFVSEDYDPSQHKSTSNESGSHARRRYKHQQRQHLNRSEQTEIYHALKPEKIYFDILPPTPVVVTDDSSSNDSKFDPAHIRVEVISLLDDDKDNADNTEQSSSITNDEEQLPSKELLNKRPKKYNQHHHLRLRRDTNRNDNQDVHMVHKRHPHYNYERVGSNSFDDYTKHLMSHWGQKHAVPGNKWNGIDGDVPPAIDFGNRFGGEDNTDRVVWGVSKANRRPLTTRRPQQLQFPPLMHNSNPNDADFSAFNNRRPIQNNNLQPSTTRRPQEPQLPPLFHNSNPEDADFSAFTRPPISRTTTASPRPAQRQPTPPSPSSNAVSTGNASSIPQCVWAIVNCCSSRDTNIRYLCFERLGCLGAFWNLNPCADNVKNSILDYVDQHFDQFLITDGPPNPQHSQHHKKVHGQSFASSPTSSKNLKTVNYENDKTEPDDVFDITDTETAATLERESEFVAPEDASHCEKATNTCCEMTELFMLYDCFNQSKCMRSIAQIMSMCA